MKVVPSALFITFVSAAFLGLVALANLLFDAGQRAYSPRSAAVATTIVVTGGVAILAALRPWRVVSHTLRLVLGSVAAATVIYAVFAFVFTTATPLLSWAAAVSILVAAAGEEALFRIILPVCLLEPRLLRVVKPQTRIIVAVIVAQLVFALAHWGRGSLAITRSPWELLRLFEAGLIYSAIVMLFGPYAAIATHASMNLDLLTSTLLFRPRATHTGMLILLPVTLILVVFTARQRSNRTTEAEVT